jgi:hypothetical protein
MKRIGSIVMSMAVAAVLGAISGCSSDTDAPKPIAGMGNPGHPPTEINGIKVDGSGQAIGAGPNEAMKLHNIPRPQ